MTLSGTRALTLSVETSRHHQLRPSNRHHLFHPRHHRWLIDDFRPPAAAAADVPSGDCLEEPTYAIFKPRNVLSATGVDTSKGQRRRTLTDVMVDAGVQPLPGHVGRLDLETSGLILVTAHGLLNNALINWPNVLEAYGGAAVTKRYSLRVAGRHEPASPQLASLSEPLIHRRNGRTFHSRAAVEVVHRRSYVDDRLPSEWRFFDATDVMRAEVAQQARAVRVPSARERWQVLTAI